MNTDEKLTEEKQAILSHIHEEWMLPREAFPYTWELSLFHAYGELCDAIKQHSPRMVEASDRYFTLCWGYCRKMTGTSEEDLLMRLARSKKPTCITDLKGFVKDLSSGLSSAVMTRNKHSFFHIVFWAWVWLELGLPWTPVAADWKGKPEGDE